MIAIETWQCLLLSTIVAIRSWGTSGRYDKIYRTHNPLRLLQLQERLSTCYICNNILLIFLSKYINNTDVKWKKIHEYFSLKWHSDLIWSI